MLYLIGGPPRVGKTTVAEALARRTSFPYFSLDHVTSVISPYIPEPDYPSRLPLRVAREETGYSNDVFYARYSAEEAVGFYLRQAETYWPVVEGVPDEALDAGSGSTGRRRSQTAIARSAPRTPTCTCTLQVLLRRAT